MGNVANSHTQDSNTLKPRITCVDCVVNNVGSFCRMLQLACETSTCIHDVLSLSVHQLYLSRHTGQEEGITRSAPPEKRAWPRNFLKELGDQRSSIHLVSLSYRPFTNRTCSARQNELQACGLVALCCPQITPLTNGRILALDEANSSLSSRFRARHSQNGHHYTFAKSLFLKIPDILACTRTWTSKHNWSWQAAKGPTLQTFKFQGFGPLRPCREQAMPGYGSRDKQINVFVDTPAPGLKVPTCKIVQPNSGALSTTSSVCIHISTRFAWYILVHQKWFFKSTTRLQKKIP